MRHSRLGRVVAASLAAKVAVQVARPLVDALAALEAVDWLATLGLLAAVAIGVARALGFIRRVVLWRVRRKLLVSYFLIGIVPAFLLVVFFVVVGVLLMFNVGSYMLRTQVAAFVETQRAQATATALELQHMRAREDAARAASARLSATAGLPARAAMHLVDVPGRCGTSRPTTGWADVRVGPWPDGPEPSVPSWLACDGYAGLVHDDSPGEPPSIAVRALAWVPGRSTAVILHVPLDAELARRLSDGTGVQLLSAATLDPDGEVAAAEARRPRLVVAPASVPLEAADRTSPGPWLRWASFLDARAWDDGRDTVIFADLGVNFAGVYRRLMAAPIPPAAEFSFAEILLVLLGVVAGLFLLIQLVAYVMGFALARSITGAVHALFEGTERVRQGDFSTTIDVPSGDQLGQLASSFNSMTTSIESLLKEKAQKERLEQELQIARGIQMSLLPQAPLACRGVVFAGHCEPARAVGGDYFDFWQIDDDRFGMLIADVAGKGTSAALYMAELKGIVLSLSQSHSSPRQLLIDANRIVSRHLDTRSFITMTYAVVDARLRTLTYVRAGHCPLIRLRGPRGTNSQPEILAPDGLVLGLTFGDTSLFERVLQEVTMPLADGDVFVLYTDGVTEAMSADGDFFGEARLTELARHHAHEPFDVLRDRVLAAVTAFAGPVEQQDDITMLVLQVQDLARAA
jgi:sigma-B regulation protein RsbU (phosphoserine phosphatase)